MEPRPGFPAVPSARSDTARRAPDRFAARRLFRACLPSRSCPIRGLRGFPQIACAVVPTFCSSGFRRSAPKPECRPDKAAERSTRPGPSWRRRFRSSSGFGTLVERRMYVCSRTTIVNPRSAKDLKMRAVFRNSSEHAYHSGLHGVPAYSLHQIGYDSHFVLGLGNLAVDAQVVAGANEQPREIELVGFAARPRQRKSQSAAVRCNVRLIPRRYDRKRRCRRDQTRASGFRTEARFRRRRCATAQTIGLCSERPRFATF